MVHVSGIIVLVIGIMVHVNGIVVHAGGIMVYAVWASRECTSDGTWWTVPGTNRTWSDYTTCIDMHGLEVRECISTNLSQ